jgi:hypothetical protein
LSGNPSQERSCLLTLPTAGDPGIGEGEGVAISVGDRHQVTCSATDLVANALFGGEDVGAIVGVSGVVGDFEVAASNIIV